LSNNSFTGITQYITEGKIGESENVIGEIVALRWEPTHVTKHAFRDIPLQARGGRLERISQNSPSYSALHYALLFPKGENRWHPRIPIYGA